MGTHKQLIEWELTINYLLVINIIDFAGNMICGVSLNLQSLDQKYTESTP